MESHLNGKVILHHGDGRVILKSLEECSIDSVVTDPPYALVPMAKRFGKPGASPAKHGADGLYARASAGFMGQSWDTGETSFAAEFWAEVLRVLKPGGHLVAFSGTRTYHRLAVAIEDAGFEIRDQLAWVYGSGYPKSHDIAKAIDKSAGHWRGRAGEVIDRSVGQAAKGTEYERSDKGGPVTAAAAAWDGWGTALKPSWEPIVLARKPLAGTVAANVLEHGTGGLNIDGCRVESGDAIVTFDRVAGDRPRDQYRTGTGINRSVADRGRWPANLVHDGSDEVVMEFPNSAGQQGDIKGTEPSAPLDGDVYGRGLGRIPAPSRRDGGSASRFFYSSKADAHDRIGSKHPTIKPIDLMQWLCRLVTPPGGVVLDPFAGSGTTGEAAWREGFRALLIEREATYCDDIRRRLRLAENPAERTAVAKAKGVTAADHGPLFGGATPPWPERDGAPNLRTLRRSGRKIGPVGLKR